MPADRPRGRVVVPSGGGRPFVQFYQEARVREYEDHIANWVRRQIAEMDVQGPAADQVFLPFEVHRLVVDVRFNMHRPVSYPKRVVDHTRKPDLDNLVKTVLDGLTKARVMKDDACVQRLGLQKHYATDEHPLGIEIDITAVVTQVP